MAAVLAIVTTVEVPVSEFVRLQRLSDDEIRRLFHLDPSCEPTLSAVRDVRTSVVVIVTCVDESLDASDADDSPR